MLSVVWPPASAPPGPSSVNSPSRAPTSDCSQPPLDFRHRAHRPSSVSTGWINLRPSSASVLPAAWPGFKESISHLWCKSQHSHIIAPCSTGSVLHFLTIPAPEPATHSLTQPVAFEIFPLWGPPTLTEALEPEMTAEHWPTLVRTDLLPSLRWSFVAFVLVVPTVPSARQCLWICLAAFETRHLAAAASSHTALSHSSSQFRWWH